MKSMSVGTVNPSNGPLEENSLTNSRHRADLVDVVDPSLSLYLDTDECIFVCCLDVRRDVSAKRHAWKS